MAKISEGIHPNGDTLTRQKEIRGHKEGTPLDFLFQKMKKETKEIKCSHKWLSPDFLPTLD